MYIYFSKASIFRKDLESVLETMLTDQFGPSRERHSRDFEKQMTKFMNVQGTVVVNSRTAALHLALLALDVFKGDQVIVPSYSEPSILYAISYVGAEPVLVDINHKNFSINIEETAKKISKKTKAVYIPHLFGVPVDVKPFLDYQVPVIEDITDSLGAELGEEKIGRTGTITVASFTDEKMITTGQGGALFCHNRHHYLRVRELLYNPEQTEMKTQYQYRLSDLLSALGMNQLKYLPRFIEKRQHIAEQYDKFFASKKIDFFNLSVDRYCTYFRYVVTLKGSLAKTIQFMKKNKIAVKQPIHQPLHKLLGQDPLKFPYTEEAWKKNLALPIYPTLKKSEIKKVCETLYKSQFID